MFRYVGLEHRALLEYKPVSSFALFEIISLGVILNAGGAIFMWGGTMGGQIKLGRPHEIHRQGQDFLNWGDAISPSLFKMIIL